MKIESPEPVLARPPGSKTIAPRRAAAESAPSFVHLENILVPLDLSEMSLESLKYAVPLARQFDAKITLLHVVEPPAYAPELSCPVPLAAEHCSVAEHHLEGIGVDRIPPGIEVDAIVRHNFVFDGILEAARETRADLVVITTHGGTALRHVLKSSTAENIVRQAPCPVLVVRQCDHGAVC